MNDILSPLDSIFSSVLDMKQASHSSRRSITDTTYDEILKNVNNVKNNIIMHLLDKESNSSQPVHNTLSYSNMLQKTSPKNNLIIPLDVDKKPTQDAASQAEKKVINILKETQTQATIVNSSTTDKGNLVLNFKHTDNIQSLKSSLVNTFGNNISMRTPIQPKIKIVNVPKHFGTTNKSDVTNAIFAENPFLKECSSKLEFLFSYESKHGKTLICKCSPDTRRLIKSNNDLLNIEFHQCRVFDRLFIAQCSRCCSVGHTKQNCKANNPICTLCAEDHEYSTCPLKGDKDRQTCHNCKVSTDENIRKTATGHCSFDVKCPIILEAKKRLLLNTDWGIDPPTHLL